MRVASELIQNLKTNSVTNTLIECADSPLDYVALQTDIGIIYGIPETHIESLVQRYRCAVHASLFCYHYALRSIEVLRLNYGSLSPNGVVVAEAAKGGGWIRIHLPKNWLIGAKEVEAKSHLKLFPTNYKQMYAATKALGLAKKYKGYKNYVVTHAGRHKLADELVSRGQSEAVGDVLSHKSKGASQWYKKEVSLKQDRERKRRQRRLQRERDSKTNSRSANAGA